MWSSAQRQVDEIGQGESSATRIEIASQQLASNDRGRLEIDELGGDELVPAQARASRVTVMPVVGECRR